MNNKTWALAGLAMAAAIATGAGVALASPDKVTFPAGHLTTNNYVKLGAIDRYDGPAVRTLYINRAAYNKFKPGQPFPDGTILFLEFRNAKKGADGQPAKDKNGHFIPEGPITGIAVQEKRKDLGAEYPPNIRNGNWDYAIYEAGGSLRPGVNTQACLQCHKPREKDDFTLVAYRLMNDLKSKKK